MPDDPAPQVTHLMQGAAAGDRTAANALLPLVYDQLRAAAQAQLNREQAGHTLQATALVHDAYLRLVGPREIPWQNRGHFYAAAAEAMRRILLDHARARVRHGGKPARLADMGDVAALTLAEPEQIVAVEEAVQRLEGDDPEAAAVVRLRFYAGLSVDHAAAALGIAPRTAARLWQYARAVLYRELDDRTEKNQ